MSTPAATRRRSPLVVTASILAVLVAIFFQFSAIFVDVLWFQQTGFQSVLFTQWIAMASVGAIGFVLTAGTAWLTLWSSYKFRPLTARLSQSAERYRAAIDPVRRLILWGGPLLLGAFTAATAAARWPVVLQFLNKTPFGQTDPQFNLDLSFFVYDVPFWLFTAGIVESSLLIAFVITLLTGFLYGGISITGRQVVVSRALRVQASIIAVAYLSVLAVQLWFKQFETLVTPSQGFLATGAGYTEVNVDIPGYQILAGIAAVVIVFFLITAVTGRWRLPLVGTAMLIVSMLVLGGVSWVIQRFQVDPSARTLESEYIQRNIDGTRVGFGLSDINELEYTAATTAEAGALRADAETTAHIRIIDPGLVPDAFAQLEQFRQYYTFPEHLDVDRYTIDGNMQDTVIAVRELNAAGLTSSTWYNDHIVYTHGYGIVAAYGNKRNVDGQPTFLESGIPVSGNLGKYEPRVYFGENSTDYSIVGASSPTGPLELDYPSANSTSDSGNAKYTFEGAGGPKLDNLMTRLIYAMHFQSEQILLSDAITDDSQILYDRHPLIRVNKVAPYLTLDNDPYPAVVDGRVVWIVDGYTTTNDFPYSTSVDMAQAIRDTYTTAPLVASGNVNYIRNSVKATVDAYDGTVTLYAWDTTDPILTTWQKIFPSTLKSASEMSAGLLSHVRYPSDLFKVQREVLGSYHVTDPGTFYSTEDTWVTPNDPVSDPAAPTLQPPYYLTMQMPGADTPSFSLYSTFIPKSTGKDARNVLYGYLSANSDFGPEYGKLTLLTLPKQTTIPGPGQVQAQFDSDATVSQQLNLLRQGKTEVIPGNLLTLPVGGGLLYVQPVYVRSTGETSYPLLRKILVAFGDSIAFEDSLDAALDSLFGGNSGVVTPVDPTDPNNPSTGGAVSAELARALADAKKALTDRQAAYAKNDLVAAAAADVRLQKALQTAYELSR